MDKVQLKGTINNQSGFTLLEVSIALSIIAILSFTVASSLQIGRSYDKNAENVLYLEHVRVALISFVQTNGYLPCPDSDILVDGVENRIAGKCRVAKGKLPYKMLGIYPKDAWGNVLYYAVNAQADNSGVNYINDSAESASYFSNDSPPKFTGLTKPIITNKGAGNYTICGETLGLMKSCKSSTADVDKIEKAAIAIVISFGKNALQPIDGPPLGRAESENMDGDRYFWKTKSSAAVGQMFDDQIIWLTGFDLKYALIRSQRGLQ